MIKRFLLSILGVYVLWAVLDFILHGYILRSVYQETAALWRPEAEMKTWFMQLVTLVLAAVFVTTYAFLVRPKSVVTGLLFGLLVGSAHGIGMGFGCYAVMPIPVYLAVSWFFGAVVEALGAGLLVGTLIRANPKAS